jgi:hypothetical protein
MSRWREVTVPGKPASPNFPGTYKNKGAAKRLKVVKRTEASERAAAVRHYRQRAHRLGRAFLSGREAREKQTAGGYFLCTCPAPEEPSYGMDPPAYSRGGWLSMGNA